MSNKWSQIPLELPVATEVKPTVWVLTSEFDAAYQYGEYFEAVFLRKPSMQELTDADLSWFESDLLLRKGNSWQEDSNNWYYLKEVTIE